VNKELKVGVAVFVIKEGKFIMLLRKGSHGAGSWSLPGGHPEFGESFETTARREVKEETNLEIKNVRFGAVTNDFFEEEGKHYITIWMISEWESGQLVLTEPEKCLDQKWHSFENLPSPLFATWKQLYTSEFLDTVKEKVSKIYN
jgi:8-oxo-dGTP diphosphatase